MNAPSTDELTALRQRLTRLELLAEHLNKEQAELRHELDQTRAFLELEPQVHATLEQLSRSLFTQLAQTLEQHLTNALQDVLEQPLRLRIELKWSESRGNTFSFYVERDGQAEDIMKGQGGSVANVLSVALRMLAVATLDDRCHRRFLVLDEPDCWLRPDLVPRLVNVIHSAARQLGFQVLLISHHDVDFFAAAAERIYRLVPTSSGARLQLLS
jgi:predicted ATPase